MQMLEADQQIVPLVESLYSLKGFIQGNAFIW